MNVVYNMDCLEAMKEMKDNEFDLAIVDPPYGINADLKQNKAALNRIKANGKNKSGRGWKLYKKSNWDNGIPTKKYFDELFRVSKNQIIWGANYFNHFLPKSMGWLVWNKMQRGFSLADGELAFTSFNKALRIYDYSRGEMLANNKQNGGRFHPTQKPVALYKWLLTNYAKQGDKILDTHLGSGSSRIACYDLGFDFVGYELDKEYFELQEKRFERHVNQLTII